MYVRYKTIILILMDKYAYGALLEYDWEKTNRYLIFRVFQILNILLTLVD